MKEQKRLDQKEAKGVAQRKTTLKWGRNGELSPIDMARVLDQLTNPELTECELACDADSKENN